MSPRLFPIQFIFFQALNLIMKYKSRSSTAGVFLIVPGLMIAIAGRLLSLSDFNGSTATFICFLADIMTYGGLFAAIIGGILLARGIAEDRKVQSILEIVNAKREATVSEINSQTRLESEYIRRTISNLISSGYLYGVFEDDRYREISENP
jgi:uncharacterized membrane protein